MNNDISRRLDSLTRTGDDKRSVTPSPLRGNLAHIEMSPAALCECGGVMLAGNMTPDCCDLCARENDMTAAWASIEQQRLEYRTEQGR